MVLFCADPEPPTKVKVSENSIRWYKSMVPIRMTGINKILVEKFALNGQCQSVCQTRQTDGHRQDKNDDYIHLCATHTMKSMEWVKSPRGLAACSCNTSLEERRKQERLWNVQRDISPKPCWQDVCQNTRAANKIHGRTIPKPVTDGLQERPRVHWCNICNEADKRENYCIW